MPAEGILYEPRSLWTVTGGQPVGDTTLGAEFDDEYFTIRCNREHFMNGGRYPITINRVAISGINYLWRRGNAALTPSTNVDYDNWSSVINKLRMRVSAPYRQDYGKGDFLLSSFPMIPTGQPYPQQDPSGARRYSSPWGITSLAFDKTLVLPRTAQIDWALSTVPQFQTAAGDLIIVAGSRIWMLVQESGGLFSGSARTFEINPQQVQNAAWGNGAGPEEPSEPGWPYGVTNQMKGVALTAVPAAQANAAWWAPQHQFNTRSFDAQESTRAGSTAFDGARVFIQQALQDLTFSDEGGSGTSTLMFPAEMSTWLGTRMRVSNGGSGEWWWRPGAPLCLVFDTMTAARVYQLPAPITIGPGDTLDVTLQIPGPNSGLGAAGNDLVRQLGISFNGYAAIEG